MTDFRGNITIETSQATSALEELSDTATSTTSKLSGLEDSSNNVSSAFNALHGIGSRLANMDLQQNIARVRGAFNDLNDVLGSPFGEGGGTIGRMMQLATSFAEVGGQFGPQGALVGGIIGAVIPALAAVSTSIQDTNRRNEEWQTHLVELNAEQQRFVSQLRTSTSAIDTHATALRNAAEDAREFIASLSREGLETAAQDTAAQVTVLSDRLAEVNDQIAALEDNPGRAALRLLELREEASGLADQIRVLNASIEDTRRTAAESTHGSGTDKLSASARRGVEAEKAADIALRADITRGLSGNPSFIPGSETVIDTLDVGALSAADSEKEKSRLQQQRELQDQQSELAKAAVDASRTFSEAWRGSVDDVIRAFDEANVAARQLGETQISQGQLVEASMASVANTALETLGKGVASAFAKSVSAAISGAESFEKAMGKMVQAVLESLLQEAIVQALREFALAIADAASYKYDSAAAHAAAGAAWVAVGVAAGAGLGAVSAANRGGASPSASPASTASAATPEESRQPSTINFYYSNPMINTDEDQRQMFRRIARDSGVNMSV